jgi:signal transduction histidine kinase
MRLPRSLDRLQPKLFLSYLLIIAVGVGGVALGVDVVAPSLFDRLLERHMNGHGGMAHRGMTTSLQADTRTVLEQTIFQSLVLTTVIATIAALAVSLFVTRRIVRPISRMAAASQAIAAGNYQTRVVIREHDELGDLAASLNGMAAALEDAEQRRVHLIGDVAHEIRTPLATVRGYLEGLSDGVVEPSPELFAQLHDETGRLQRLVDDLQELSRVESGRVALTPRRIAPARLIDAAVSRLASAFDEKGVRLSVERGSGLPDVLADEDRTIQVLTNLLSNALRYTPGEGEVRLGAAREDQFIRFSVRDTGTGIASEHLSRVFDRFYRVDPARSRAMGGSGIGLTIARSLVESQGGSIGAESAGPGQGSLFSFTLPIAR